MQFAGLFELEINMSKNSDKSREKYVKCPYFVKFNSRGARYIVCTGIVNKCNIHLCFDSNKKMFEYADDFCNSIGCWQGCPIAKMSMENEDY